MAKKKERVVGPEVLSELSMADLYAMYLIVISDRNKGFGLAKEIKSVVDSKIKEIQDEIYLRIYGQNIFEISKVSIITTVIEGEKPEDVLKGLPATEKPSEKIAAVTKAVEIDKEAKNESPEKTFAVFKNEENK